MARVRTIIFGNSGEATYVARKYVWSGMRVFPDQGAVEVVASPWSQARVIARDASGRTRGEAVVDTGSASVARGMIGDGRPLTSGDVVSLAVDGIEVEWILPELWIDWSVNRAVMGSSARRRDTQLVALFADGATETIVPQWTTDTHFTVSIEAMRQLERAATSNITGIRVTVNLAPMCDVIVQTDGFDSSVRGRWIYLP
ncbi:MAG: hypothetical protein U0361_00160, partial [Nitrospiraceae bacterium]